jgi:aromatic ring-cleaving dioxygenase
MSERLTNPARIAGYHAHLYYEPETRRLAEELRERIAERFAVRVGSWHDEPVGPHPSAMFQVAFPVAEFARFVPWLMLNHGALSVLIHPTTEDALADHSRFAMWLGSPLPLRLEVLRSTQPRIS